MFRIRQLFLKIKIMKTLLLGSQSLLKIPLIHLVMPLLLLGLWFSLPKIIGYLEPTAGLLDAGVVQVILLSFTCYFILLIFCWLLLNRFWRLAGLTQTKQMVSQFQTLMTWQQLGFYWASFALLLLAGVGCLAAVL